MGSQNKFHHHAPHHQPSFAILGGLKYLYQQYKGKGTLKRMEFTGDFLKELSSEGLYHIHAHMSIMFYEF